VWSAGPWPGWKCGRQARDQVGSVVGRPVTSLLGISEATKSFLRGAQIFWTASNSFKLCPTHFSRRGENFSRGTSPPCAPHWLRAWWSEQRGRGFLREFIFNISCLRILNRRLIRNLHNLVSHPKYMHITKTYHFGKQCTKLMKLFSTDLSVSQNLRNIKAIAHCVSLIQEASAKIGSSFQRKINVVQKSMLAWKQAWYLNYQHC